MEKGKGKREKGKAGDLGKVDSVRNFPAKDVAHGHGHADASCSPFFPFPFSFSPLFGNHGINALVVRWYSR